MKRTSIFLALMCSAGLLSAQTTITRSGTVFTADGPGLAWSNPENLGASDNNRANANDGALLGSTNETTQVMQARGFGFSLPLNAIITAVQVHIERRRTSGNTYDNTLYLLKGGAATGNNKAVTGTNWPTSDAVAAYGNTTNDLWGATLTPFDVNSANFGLALSATLSNPSIVAGSVSADIDYVDIAVTYTLATTPDKDGDGKPDITDFDADNDGIPNNRELTRCTGANTFAYTAQADGTNPADNDILSGGLTVNTARATAASITTFGIDNYYSATTEKEIHIVQTASSSANRTTLTLTLSKAIANPRFYIQDIDASPGQFIDNVKVTAYYLGQAYTLTAAEVATSTANSFIGGNTIQGASTAADNTTDGQVQFKLNTLVDKIVIEYWNSDAGAGNQGMGIGGFSFCDLAAMDSDGDGVPNHLDADSDGDGIPDLVEGGGVDINGDGRIDGTFADSDGDGLADKYDPTTGGYALLNLDTDGDGIPNSQDMDSDNDGLPDVIEAGGADANNDGKLDSTTDTDGDGLADAVDGDANNDGIAENTANALLVTGGDANSDGLPDSYPNKNADKTGLPDLYDLDADGDGILDVTEIGLTDADRNGLADGADANGDGWSDTVDALPAIVALNSDSDGLPDYRDIDSDNDGITDNVEGQTTMGYMIPSGTDADKDGIDDAYDNNTAAFGGNANNGLVPYNFDGDLLPDYRDTDADNDGRLDIVEGHDYNLNGIADDYVTLANTDSDGDGLDDTFDMAVGPVVVQNGLITGGAVGTHATPGAKGPLQKTGITQPDRDWRYNNAVVLPLTLTSFEGQLQNAEALLSWTVSHAGNVARFDIEKSIDGSRFVRIGSVDYSNTTSFAFTDGDAREQKLYYRLRIVDQDGSANYSRVLTFTNDVRNGGMSAYPNPTSGTVYVHLPSTGNVQIALANATGQVVRSWKMRSSGADLPLSLSGLAKGQYFLTVRNADGEVTGTQGLSIVQ